MAAKRTDELFELVKSLTSSEKRYFKLFATRHVTNNENLYLELFNYIDAQESYDEKLLKKDFEGSKLLKQLPVLKNYLKQNILKSLRAFHTEVGTRREVNAMIDYSIILIKKRLFTSALRMIKKATKICWENDQYDQVVFLEHMKLIINRREGNIQAVRHYVEEGYQEELRAIEYQKNHLLYLRLMLEFENYYENLGSHATEEELKPLHELIKHPLLQDDKQAITFKSKGNFWDIHCKYYALVGNRIKEYESWEEIIKLQELYPKSIIAFSSHYIEALAKTIELGQSLNKKDRVEVLLEKLNQFPEQFKFSNYNFVKNYASQNYHLLKMTQLLIDADVESAIELAEKFKKRLTEIEKTGTETEILSIYLQLAKVYFYAKNYEETLSWIDKLLYDTKNDLQKNIKIQAMLISIILHYELENESYIISLIRSYRRKLKSQKEFLAVEFSFFSIFLKVIKTVDITAKTNYFKQLKTEFLSLESSNEKAKFYNYQLLIKWLDEKVS